MTSNHHFRGKLYRALNPVWARDPLSGAGAALYGGRFNPRGMPALYCSLSPHTALREANQVGDLQPTTLVAYEADIAQVFDATDPMALALWQMTPAMLADAGWRAAMLKQGEAPTQAFARTLIGAGYAAMRVPSYARGTRADDLNLVIWRWGNRKGAKLRVVDDEGRLG